MKIKLQKAKIEAMQEYLRQKNKFAESIQNIRDVKSALTTNTEEIKDKFKELINYRKELIINENFTDEDYKNVYDFVKFLNNEEYEKMVNFEVI